MKNHFDILNDVLDTSGLPGKAKSLEQEANPGKQEAQDDQIHRQPPIDGSLLTS